MIEKIDKKSAKRSPGSRETTATIELGQRQLRQTLQRLQSKIPNQLGRLTDRPTLRWLFQCFQSIHVLGVRQSVEISNLTNERLSLLKFFPPACQRYYLLS